ncbi:MAG: aquaporin [Candidatus Methanoplasma sp.]|jgi:aquaporin Z|nr:aquaporin [Candidatus Methanoplasma sp.]
METNRIRKYFAELVGTLILVFMGCGAAVFLGCSTNGGHLAVALAFGLSIVAAAYVIGPISGCHINPAVSLGMLLTKRIGIKDFTGYVVFQIIGAVMGAALLWGLVSITGIVDLTAGALGANSAAATGVAGAVLVEIILTFIFVLTILGVTSDKTKGSVAGIVIGLTLAFVHIVGIPLTGTSVNPARSIGPAIFSNVGSSLPDLWIFIVAPLIGAAIAAAVFIGLYGRKKASGEEDI